MEIKYQEIIKMESLLGFMSNFIMKERRHKLDILMIKINNNCYFILYFYIYFINI